MFSRDSFVQLNKTEGEKLHVREQAAEKLGVSETQLYRINYVYEHEFIPAVKPIVEKLDRIQDKNLSYFCGQVFLVLRRRV